MRPLTAVLICTLAALLYVACASPEPANTNSAGATTANANSATAPAMTNPSPSPTQNPAASAQPGPTVITARPATSPGAKPADQKPAPPPAGSSANAAELFTVQKCAICHGTDGKGKLKGSPDFTDAAWQKKQTDAEMIEAIKKGHKPMPAYEGKLSDEQITALVAYVRAFGKK